MSRKARPRFVVICAMVLAAALARLLPHPPNVTPVVALSLFAGVHCPRSLAAVTVPLGAMLLSDLLMEVMGLHGIHPLLPVVYACMVLTAWLGRALRSRVRPGTILGGAVLAALAFFLVTNLAVWAFGGLYPRSLAGLVACYLAALPFFGNTLAGTAAYAAVLFGTFAVAERRLPALATPHPGARVALDRTQP